MRVCVTNSGVGLNPSGAHLSNGHGFGLTNIKSRLNLHYGEASSLSITELDPKHVQVTILLPVQFEDRARHGAQ
jgi:two-component system LytT family sensor kinase